MGVIEQTINNNCDWFYYLIRVKNDTSYNYYIECLSLKETGFEFKVSLGFFIFGKL